MKRKIAILIYSLTAGGAERSVANILNYLDRDKYDVRLILMNEKIEYEIPEQQIIHYIEKSNIAESNFYKLLKIPLLSYRLLKYCKEHQIELVFAVMNRPNMIATMAKWFGLKARVLISEQFYTPYFYNNLSIANRFKTFLLKWLYAKADCILPNSRGTMNALQNIYNINTDYVVIRNPTDIEKIKILSDEKVNDTIDFKKFTFINVSAFREEKNHILLINAVAQLKERDFQLLLIGKGPMLNSLKLKVKTLGLENKIIFIPYTTNPFKYLSRSSCFLLSSFTEGFPNILIESLVCSLPIISVDCKTGPRELLAPGTDLNTVLKNSEFEIAEFGILCAVNSQVSLAAAITWAMENPEKLKLDKQKVENKINEFQSQKVVDELSITLDKYLQ